MSRIEVVVRDVFARHTGTDGTSHVSSHRVMEPISVFIEARERDARQANSKVEGDAPRLAKFEQITEEEYNRHRGGKWAKS